MTAGLHTLARALTSVATGCWGDRRFVTSPEMAPVECGIRTMSRSGLCVEHQHEIVGHVDGETSNCAREDEPRRNWCLPCVEDRYEDCDTYGAPVDA